MCNKKLVFSSIKFIKKHIKKIKIKLKSLLFKNVRFKTILQFNDCLKFHVFIINLHLYASEDIFPKRSTHFKCLFSLLTPLTEQHEQKFTTLIIV